MMHGEAFQAGGDVMMHGEAFQAGGDVMMRGEAFQAGAVEEGPDLGGLALAWWPCRVAAESMLHGGRPLPGAACARAAGCATGRGRGRSAATQRRGARPGAVPAAQAAQAASLGSCRPGRHA